MKKLIVILGGLVLLFCALFAFLLSGTSPEDAVRERTVINVEDGFER